MLSERTKLAIKFWSGRNLTEIAKEMNRSNKWVSINTDYILATRPRYNK